MLKHLSSLQNENSLRIIKPQISNEEWIDLKNLLPSGVGLDDAQAADQGHNNHEDQRVDFLHCS